jgi:hypothetical protein
MQYCLACINGARLKLKMKRSGPSRHAKGVTPSSIRGGMSYISAKRAHHHFAHALGKIIGLGHHFAFQHEGLIEKQMRRIIN